MPINGVTFGTGITVTPGVTAGGYYTGTVALGRSEGFYYWSDDTGFGTKYSATGLNSNSIVWAPDGAAVVATGQSVGNRVAGFPWIPGVGLGTKFAVPANVNNSEYFNAVFNPAGTVVFAVTGSPARLLDAWQWNSSTGFGTKYNNVTYTAEPNNYVSQIAVHPTGDYVLVAADNSFRVYSWNDVTGFGSFVSLGSLIATSVAWHPSGNFIAVAGSGTLRIFPWDPVNGIGSQFSSGSFGSLSGSAGVYFNTDGSALIVTGFNTGSVYAFPFSTATGLGASSSLTNMAPEAYSARFSPSGRAIVVGTSSTSSYVKAYSYSVTGGIGAAYSNPSQALSTTTLSVDFSP